ncbi:hypothetical protein CDAR_370671 [Caerostris darwini]|uniref:Uncharacterized protein n=1 Tax=Caerostris darwini TaxID=1538125 RepID=A0AAV4VFU0_9ARAC|nr:hypothetical protein CDAR_370671 [Caerostris darwini]
MDTYRTTKSSGTGIPDPCCPQGRRLGKCRARYLSGSWPDYPEKPFVRLDFPLSGRFREDSLMADLYEFLKKGERRKMEDPCLELRFYKSRFMFILDASVESLEGCCVFIEFCFIVFFWEWYSVWVHPLENMGNTTGVNKDWTFVYRSVV